MTDSNKMEVEFDPNEVKLYFKNQLPGDLEKIRQSKGMFTDPFFPPDDNAIDSKKVNGTKLEFVDKVEGKDNEEEINNVYNYTKNKRDWARPEEVIPGKWQIFEGNIELDDIVQGNLGNCYFISAVAALVEFPDLLKRNFPEQKYEDIGYYEVVLYIDGQWQRVFIDNYIPVYKNYKQKKSYEKDPAKSFVFSCPNGKELWAILLEKAWAKVNGGYSNTLGGNQYEVLLALTGYPSEIIQSNSSEPLKIFRIIEKADEEDAVMGCASYPGQDTDENEFGICYGHAYTLIDAKTKKEDLGEINLYKIRNPWGNYEWKGNYSDNDQIWKNQELADYFGQTFKDDGMFFMSADDYPANFLNTQICRIIKGAKHRSYLINKEEMFKGALVYNLYMPENGNVIFSIVERNRRFNRELPYEKYAFFSLFIFKYDEEYNISKFYGGSSNFMTLGIHQELEQGYYACVIYFPYEYLDLGQNFNYTFTIFTSTQFDSKFTGKDPSLQCLQKLIIEYYKASKKFEIDTTAQKISTDFKEIYNATNMIPRIFYNKLNQKLKFEIKFDKGKNKGFAVVGQYDEKYWNKSKDIILNKDQFGIFLTARTSLDRKYAPSVKTSYGPSVNELEPSNHENYSFKNLLQFNIKDDNDFGVKEKSKVASIFSSVLHSAQSRLTLENENLIKDEEKFTNPVNKISTYENLKKEFPKEFEILEKETQEKPEFYGNNWIKFVTNSGTYVGQINKQNKIEGRGIFLYKNNQTFIGVFKNGTGDEFGLIFGPDKKLTYKGQIEKGVPNGFGIMLKENNSWIGHFVSGKIEGFTTANIESNNNKYQWLGNYTNNKENGVGLMKCENTKNYTLYKYDMGKPIGQIPLTENDETDLKNKRDKLYSLLVQFSMGNSSLNEINNEQKSTLKYFTDFYNYKTDSKKYPKPNA